MEFDNFEARRKKVLEDLKGHKKTGHKYNIRERLKEVMEFEKQEEALKAQQKDFEHYIGMFTLSEKTRGYVEREGDRIAGFKIFDRHEELIDWAEKKQPNLVIIDVDPPVEDADTFNLFTVLSMSAPDIKFCLLTDRGRTKVAVKLCRQGAIAVLKKPIQLLEVKHILKGNVPIECRPFT